LFFSCPLPLKTFRSQRSVWAFEKHPASKTTKSSVTALHTKMGSYSNAPSTSGGYSITPRRNMRVDWRTKPAGPEPGPFNSRTQRQDQTTPTQKTAFEPAEQQILSEQRYWLSSRKVLKRHEFYPGMIIRAPLYEEDYADGKDAGLPILVPGSNVSAATSISAAMSHISLSNYGYVHSKLRYMIVLATFRYHYMAIPLYTYEGKGLKDKPRDFQDECVSVRDGRLSKAAFAKISRHAPLVTKTRNDRHNSIKETSKSWV